MALSFVTDGQGRTWIGKGSGLSCYNGETYLVYDADGEGGLPEAHIRDLCISGDGTLWIGDNRGVRFLKDGVFRTLENAPRSVVMRVQEYSPGSMLFSSRGGIYMSTPDGTVLSTDLNGLSFTSHLAVAPDGGIWTATHYLENNHVFKLSSSLEVISDMTLPSNVNVVDLSIMESGEVWTVTDHGVLIYDCSTAAQKKTPSSVEELVRGKEALFAKQYQNGSVLLGIKGDGLFGFRPAADRLTRLFPEERLMSDSYACYVSPSGRIWLSNDNGPSRMYWNGDRFTNLITEIQPEYFSSSNEMEVDHNGNLWIARGNWLLGYDPIKDELFQKIYNETGFVLVREEGGKRLWTMIGRGELRVYDLLDGKAVFLGTRKLNGDYIGGFNSDGNGHIWLMRSNDTRFLDSFSEIERIFPVKWDFVQSTMKDRGTGKYYLKSRDGSLYECSDSLIKTDLLLPEIEHPFTIFTGYDGTLYVGTTDDGIYYRRKSDSGFSHLGRGEGLPEDEIRGIIGDRQGIIWIATKSRISRYDPANGSITVFSASGFSAERPFSHNSGVLASDGNVYFCGEGGVAKVDVSRGSGQSSVPEARIDYVSVNGEYLLRNGEKPVLKHDKDNLRFNFSSIGEGLGERRLYSFMMQGLDRAWTVTDNPEASYHSLRPGKYTFTVRSTDSLGNCGTQDSFTFRIKPPFWTSNFAKALYAILTLLLVGSLIRFYIYLSIQREKALSAEEREKMKQDEVDYLTNLTHELRNPLTMIYGPVRQLSADPEIPERERNLLKVVRNSTSMLRNITDEIMNISGDSEVKEPLKVSKTDLSALVGGLAESSRYAFDEKGITLQTSIPGSVSGWADFDKVYKILMNLLTNALKYTPEGGTVKVNLSSEDGYATATVEDNGPGVPAGKEEEIFTRYARLEKDKAKEGSGVGLHYSRSLATIHKGSLIYSPSENGGSTFTLTIPISEGAYGESERTERTSTMELLSKGIASDGDIDHSKKTILVVEDSSEISMYLRYIFSEKFNVFTSPDGGSALKSMMSIVPDLVISDYMMPGMDGMELCRKIKEDDSLHAIPFILLTAKTDTETNKAGLENGADAFVFKPFDPGILMATAEGLIRNRELLQAKALKAVSSYLDGGKGILEGSDGSAFSERDRTFLEKYSSIVKENIPNDGFTIESLAKEMLMSYSSLYAMSKTLTGLTPQAYLVRMRMEEAKRLVCEGSHNLTEISEMVGYGSLSHFSREFKKYYGESPSAFAKGSSVGRPQ